MPFALDWPTRWAQCRTGRLLFEAGIPVLVVVPLRSLPLPAVHEASPIGTPEPLHLLLREAVEVFRQQDRGLAVSRQVGRGGEEDGRYGELGVIELC